MSHSFQDELTGALVGLSRATDGGMQATPEMWRLMIEGLFTTVTNVNFNENTIRELIGRVHAEKARLAPDCARLRCPLRTHQRLRYEPALERR